MGKWMPCERSLRALTFALVFVALGWICTAAPAHAKTYNVANYNIFPDGNDYTTQIQSLLDEIPSGSTVNFPAGTYILSAGVTSYGVKLVGLGQGATFNMVSSEVYGGGAIILAGSKASIQNIEVDWNGSEFAIEWGDIGYSISAGVYLLGDAGSITGCTFNGWPQIAAAIYETTGNSTVTGSIFNLTENATGVALLNAHSTNQKVTVTANTFNVPEPFGYSEGIDAFGPNALTANQNSFTNLGFAINASDGSYTGTISATYNIFTGCYYGLIAQGEDSLTFSNNDVYYTFLGIGDNENGGAVINDNSFYSMEGAIGSGNDSGTVTAKGNTVVSAETAFSITSAYSFVGSTNNINSASTAIRTGGITVKLTNNFINNCNAGISDQGSESVTAQNNAISNESSSAIYLAYNAGADTVSGNTLSNVGTAGGVNAAIDIESPTGTVSVTGNTYNQTSPYNTPETEPTYYIYVSQGTPTVQNNKTNTMLANFP